MNKFLFQLEIISSNWSCGVCPWSKLNNTRPTPLSNGINRLLDKRLVVVNVVTNWKLFSLKMHLSSTLRILIIRKSLTSIPISLHLFHVFHWFLFVSEQNYFKTIICYLFVVFLFFLFFLSKFRLNFKVWTKWLFQWITSNFW